MKFETTKIYTVHIKPTDPYPHETAEFIDENATIWGFVFHGFWLLYHRAWIAGIGVLLLWALLAVGGGTLLGLHPAATYAVNLALRLFVAFDGNELRRIALKRRGYITADIVVGESELAAKRRFFQRWLESSAPDTSPHRA